MSLSSKRSNNRTAAVGVAGWRPQEAPVMASKQQQTQRKHFGVMLQKMRWIVRFDSRRSTIPRMCRGCDAANPKEPDEE
jgi:hypothetical protein